MNTQEKKDKIVELVRELGKEGVAVEVESQTLFNVTKKNTVIHTVNFKETTQC